MTFFRITSWLALLLALPALGGACSGSTGSPAAAGGTAAGGGAVGAGGSAAPASGGESAGTGAGAALITGGTGGGVDEASLTWAEANLTWYESYPDPGSEECVEYNGCMWAGYFAALPDKQTEEWVSMTNIVAIHEKDFEQYKLKTLRLRQGDLEIDAVVYDKCADSDCDGCCTANSAGTGFLIDVESHTRDRFGSGAGVVTWACLDCD